MSSSPKQDVYKEHAEAARRFEEGNQLRHAPKEKQEKRIKKWDTYYGKVMPFLYSRCFGLWGLVRKLLAQLIGLSRPIVRQVSEGDVRVVVHKSCALAVQTFMLAMSEAGYDTCPLEGFDSRLVKKALGLPIRWRSTWSSPVVSACPTVCGAIATASHLVRPTTGYRIGDKNREEPCIYFYQSEDNTMPHSFWPCGIVIICL